MKQRRMFSLGFVLSSCLVFAACAPKQPEPEVVVPSSPVQALPVEETRETVQIQQNICGKLPAERVSQLLGTSTSQPSVTMIGSAAGTTRHICTYSRSGNLAVNLLNMTVAFKKENKAENFQAMWDAQKENARTIEGIGVEAYTKEVNNQPMLYILTDDAQYWLQLAETSLNTSQQLEKLKEITKTIVQ